MCKWFARRRWEREKVIAAKQRASRWLYQEALIPEQFYLIKRMPEVLRNVKGANHGC